MANVIYSFDTKLVVASSNKSDILLGQWSTYKDNQHPGTKNQILGWQFDSRIWSTTDTQYPTFAPSIADPDLSLIPITDFQSGTGIKNDCEVNDITAVRLSDFVDGWGPNIEHGYYYSFNKEYYLYSDAVITKNVDSTDINNGVNFIDLSEQYKDTVPVLVRSWIWDDLVDEYKVNILYKKKVYFTGSRTSPNSARQRTWDANSQSIIYSNIDQLQNEFVIQNNFINNPRIIFNKIVTSDIGIHVVASSDLSNLELVGSSDGTAKQIFHTKYSPIDKNKPIEIYSYLVSGSSYITWTPKINSNLTHSGNECILDTNLGTIQFGDPSQGDSLPPPGHKIVIRYTSTVEVKYEPRYSIDTLNTFTKEVNINPTFRSDNRGFILIKNTESIPAKIYLYTDLTAIATNLYSPLDIGDKICPIHALVTNKSGEPIESLKVNFKLLDNPSVGSFSNDTNQASSFTNTNGIASVFYLPPKNIDDIGEYIPASGYSTSGGNTILTTQNLRVTSTLTDIYIYKVWIDDPILGINIGNNNSLNAGLITQELDNWYRDNFFNPERIFGPTGIDSNTGNPSGDLQTGATLWEERHRLILGLLKPASYNRLIRNGRKQIVSTWSGTALDPHIHENGAFIPLQPSAVTSVTTLINKVQFPGTLDAPGSNNLDAYFIISPCNLQIQATLYDEITDRIIYSNVITIKLHIPDSLNGTVYINDINDLPTNIVPYVLNSGDDGKILPLGFKIKQSGNTFASAIGGVTYLDINGTATLDMTFNVSTIR